jgi:hypothetical protein
MTKRNNPSHNAPAERTNDASNRLRGLVGIFLALALTLATSAPLLAQAAAGNATPVLATVSVETKALGREIPRNFVGFSLEVSTGGQGITAFQGKTAGSEPAEQEVYALGHPGAPNAGYFRFMRNLGPGILRLGGNSQDNTCWDKAQAPHPEGCEAELKAGDLKLFSEAAQASGWRLIVGLNLKQNSPSWALREVTEGIARDIKPQQILGLELGNEPDLFTRTPYRPKIYSAADQVKDFLGYFRAFQADPAAKAYAVLGPATCCSWRNPQDLTTFIDGVGRKNLKWVTVHNYSETTCGGKTVSIERLLSPELMNEFNDQAKPLVAVARERGLPIAMAETNSASCGGMPGVSNAFAAALWGLDFTFSLAEDGFVNVDYHTSYRPGGSSYNPVNTYGKQDASGKWHYRNVAEPLYYGLYLFTRDAPGGRLLPVTVKTAANIRAYAVSRCAACAVKVFVLNKDSNASGEVRVHLARGMEYGSLLLLDAPKLDSRAPDIHYGGRQFNSAGVIASPMTQAIKPDAAGDYVFALPNAAVAVLTVEPARPMKPTKSMK